MTKTPRPVLAALLLGAVLYFFNAIFKVGVPGTIFDALLADLGGSASTVVALSTSFTIFSAADLLLGGTVVDRFGGFRVLLVAGAVLCFGALLFPLGQSAAALIGSRCLVGLGSGLLYLALVKEIDRSFDRKYFAMIMGVLFLAGYGGSAVATTPLALAAARFGWRPPLFAAAAVSTLALLGIVLCVRRIPLPPRSRKRFSFHSYAILLRNRPALSLYYCAGGLIMIFYLLQGVVGKKFLEDVTGCGPRAAANVIFLCMVLAMIQMCLAGSWSYLCGNRRRPFLRYSCFALCGSAVLLLVGLAAGAGFYFFAFVMVLMTSAYGFAGLFTATAREYNPPQCAALTAGLLNFFGNALLVLAAFFTGCLLDLFGGTAPAAGGAAVYPAGAYFAIFLGCFLYTLPMLFMAGRFPESDGQNIAGLLKQRAARSRRNS